MWARARVCVCVRACVELLRRHITMSCMFADMHCDVGNNMVRHLFSNIYRKPRDGMGREHHCCLSVIWQRLIATLTSIFLVFAAE